MSEEDDKAFRELESLVAKPSDRSDVIKRITRLADGNKEIPFRVAKLYLNRMGTV